MILFRPTGLAELKLVASLGWAAWPPRLPDQPIFYPVLSLEYARRIARDWNAKSRFSVGFVTTFELEGEFARRYPVQLAGGRAHEELWVPAAELDDFNAHIVGPIDVLEAYTGPGFTGVIDPETNVPTDLSESYRSRAVALNTPAVRVATERDVDASVALLIASITKLCAADHLNDPATLSHWLRNKTNRDFEQWLTNPENFVIVAELRSKICGVALLRQSGMIHLCYVLPGMQRHGVGRALMHQLEAEATRRGLKQLRLTSSGNARQFYERLGYIASGNAQIAFGVLKEYPYAKTL